MHTPFPCVPDDLDNLFGIVQNLYYGVVKHLEEWAMCWLDAL
jgi:hypothetical protein